MIMRVARWCRSYHKWLGLLLFPWVIIYGVTGFYMNHPALVLSVFPADRLDEKIVEDAVGRFAQPEQLRAWLLAQSHADNLRAIREEMYHGHNAWIVTLRDEREIILFKNSTQHIEKSVYSRILLAQDSEVLDRRIYWRRILEEFHKRGLVASPWGPLLADVFAAILVMFGISGILTWTLPRLARWRLRGR